MIQLSRWKVILVALAMVLGVIFSLPNVLPAETRERLPGWMPKNTLNLGLDLQGGSHLLLQVDTEALRAERISNLAEDVDNALSQARIPHRRPVRGDASVTVTINDPEQADAALQALRALVRPSLTTGSADLNVSRGQTPDQFVVALSADAISREASDAVAQSIEVIRRRVDALGTREPSISRQGDNRIVVQAPGESDPQRLMEVIGQTARLTFHEVGPNDRLGEALATGRTPPGWMIRTEAGQPYLLRERPLLTGEMLTNATVAYDQNNQPAVGLSFNGEGARIFGRYTTQNVGESFAIVLDDEIISVARIISPIPGGTGQITNVGGLERASELALLLRSGALPAPLTVEEQRTVSAGLGADAVQAGKLATAVAFVLVLAFMIAAYGFLFGGISVVALLANGLLIIAAMSATQATLTLPGIAGLILTLAMAVDANVLIYERIRDEIRAGRSPIAAMDAGFSRAMVTIVDANLTTLIAAWIMFFFGAGPVRGFAWTLSIGVITSVFTAVLITQILLALWHRAVRPKTVPIA